MFPPEVYQEILLNLPLHDLLRAAQACWLFNGIARWCLGNERYYGRWLLSLRESNGCEQLIPMDILETKAQLFLKGLYVFQSDFNSILWYQYTSTDCQLLHLNSTTITFALRFLDLNDKLDCQYMKGAFRPILLR